MDTYLLPRMDECLDSLGNIKVFSALDAVSGYEQMPTPKSDRDKAAFKCNYDLYQFSGIPFRLIDAPAMFQMAMDMLLSPFRWKSRLVYRDNFIIFRKSWQEDMAHVDEIFSVLEQAGFKPKLRISELFFEKMK